MSRKCAKCEKTVYPLEELKCLDKVWHKTCFRCQECNMILNMKNYKGYGKMPYCNAHYPTTKFTSVAETPEMSRLAQNTKMQSQVKYHEDFEKNIKGTKRQVADDPETLRIRAGQAIISEVDYRGLRDKAADMEVRRPTSQHSDDGHPQSRRISDYDPSRVGGVKMAPNPVETAKPSPYSNKNQGHSITYGSEGKVEAPRDRNVGSIADYDPVNEHFGSLNTGYRPVSTTSQTAEWEEVIPEPRAQNHAPPSIPVHEPPPQAYEPAPGPQVQAPRTPSPEPNYPPEDDVFKRQSSHSERREQHYPPPQHAQHLPPQKMPPPQPMMGQPSQPQMPPMHQMPQSRQPEPVPVAQPAAPPSNNSMSSSGLTCQAVYDYEAQDEDEISFIDGDLIIDCQPIDDGWMFGTVRRTGKRGMLPANYVEQM